MANSKSIGDWFKSNPGLSIAIGGALASLAGLVYWARSGKNVDEKEIRTQYVIQQLGERFVRVSLCTWNLSDETVLNDRLLGTEKLKAFSNLVKKFDIGSFNLSSTRSLALKRLTDILSDTHELIQIDECRIVLFVRSSMLQVQETGFSYLGTHNAQRFLWARLKVQGMVTSFMVAGVNLSKQGCHYEETTNNNPRHQEIRDLITSIDDVKSPSEPVIITGAFRSPYPVIDYLAPDYSNTFESLGQSCPSNFPSTHHTGPAQISQFIFINRFCEPISTETLRNMGAHSAHEPVCATFNVDVDYDRETLKDHLELLVRGHSSALQKRGTQTDEETPGPDIIISPRLK